MFWNIPPHKCFMQTFLTISGSKNINQSGDSLHPTALSEGLTQTQSIRVTKISFQHHMKF
jgi:hypothetical protein